MTTQLPLHPTMRHPLTGQPLRALYVDSRGRARWPIMGADEPTEADKAKAAEAEQAKTAAAAKAKADADAAREKARAASVPENYAIDREGQSLGYPLATPVSEMKPEEKAAYHLHNSRKHEHRNAEWKQSVGDRTPEQVKADLAEFDKLKREKMTDAEKAREDAAKEGKQTGITTAGRKLAGFAFDMALAHVPEDRRKVLLENVDLSRVISSDGDLDTDKVKSIAEALAPKSGKDTQRHDYGNGPRGSTSKSGVAAGRSRYQERHGKKDTGTQ